MENRAHAFAAGIFVLVLAVLLVFAALWLGGGTTRGGVPYDFITKSSVAGLDAGAPVRLRGVEVGQVQTIGLDPSNPRRVRVRALVDPSVAIPDGTHATISYLGIAGTAYVELDYPDSASRTLQTSAEAPARIPMRTSGLAQLTDASDDLIKTFTETLQRVNALLTPQTSRNIAQLMERLNESAEAITSLTRDLQPVAHHVDKVITDADDLVASIRTTVTDADALVVSANTPGGAIDAVREGALSTGRAARDIRRELIDETLPRIDRLADRLARTSDSLDQLLQHEPQSLIFGPPAPSPGPGEPGFRRTARQ